MEHDIRLVYGVERLLECAAPITGYGGSRRIDVDHRHVGPGQACRQIADQKANHPRPNDDNPITGSRARIPQRVQGRLHVGGERGPAARHIYGDRNEAIGGCDEAVLMRVERENSAPLQVVGTLLDYPDSAVAVFDRKREIATLHRGAHALVLEHRDAALEHQAFGATAQSAPERPNPGLAESGRRQWCRPQLRPAPGGIPECACGSCPIHCEPSVGVLQASFTPSAAATWMRQTEPLGVRSFDGQSRRRPRGGNRPRAVRVPGGSAIRPGYPAAPAHCAGAQWRYVSRAGSLDGCRRRRAWLDAHRCHAVRWLPHRGTLDGAWLLERPYRVLALARQAGRARRDGAVCRAGARRRAAPAQDRGDHDNAEREPGADFPPTEGSEAEHRPDGAWRIVRLLHPE